MEVLWKSHDGCGFCTEKFFFRGKILLCLIFKSWFLGKNLKRLMEKLWIIFDVLGLIFYVFMMKMWIFGRYFKQFDSIWTNNIETRSISAWSEMTKFYSIRQDEILLNFRRSNLSWHEMTEFSSTWEDQVKLDPRWLNLARPERIEFR